MSDEAAGEDPELARLVEILSKDEDEVSDEEWDLLSGADEAKVTTAAAALGLNAN